MRMEYAGGLGSVRSGGAILRRTVGKRRDGVEEVLFHYGQLPHQLEELNQVGGGRYGQWGWALDASLRGSGAPSAILGRHVEQWNWGVFIGFRGGMRV